MHLLKLKKLRSLSLRRMPKTAAACAGAMLIVAAFVLVRAGVPAKVYAWTIYPSVSYSTVYTGEYTTVSWSAPSSDYCTLNSSASWLSGQTCQQVPTQYGQTCDKNGSCTPVYGPPYTTQCSYSYRVNGASGSVSTGPINSATPYRLYCYNESGGVGSSSGFGYTDLTVYPSTRTATSLNYFYASPSSVAYNGYTTLYYSGNPGTSGYGLYLSGYGYLSGWSGGLSRGPLTANTSYAIYTEDNYYGQGGPWYTSVSVGAASVSADATPTTQTITAGQSATIAFYADSAQPPSTCEIDNYNGTVALLSVAGCSSAQGRTYNTGAINTPGTYSYRFYYYRNSAWTLAKTVSVVVNPITPTPTISANPTTVNAGATSALAWSVSNLAAGSCTLSAPSSGAAATNFGSITSGTRTSNYYSENAVVNGWVYNIGGYNGSTYVSSVYKAPASSDLTNPSSWSSEASMPSTVAIFDKPLLIGSNLWSFGGIASSGGGAWSSNICYVPVGTGSLGSWSCPASLPTGAAQGYSDPVIVGDYIYRIGGYNYTTYAGPVAAVDRAPLSSPGSWTNFTNVLPQAMYNVATAVIGNYVYLFGGYNGSAYLNTIYRAPVSADLTLSSSWSSGGVLPTTLASPEVAVDANYAYLIGGYTGGAAVNTIYKIPLSTLAAGGVAAGSWSSAGTLPIALNHTESIIVNDKLYLMGGWQSGNYISKIFSVPFNDGLPYTSPANLPWHTTGNANSAATWPIVADTTYALSCTNSAGTGNASATVTVNDMCTDIAGYQTTLPPGCTGPTPSPKGLCIPSGYVYNGSSCVVAPPPPVSIGAFFGPGRVRSGNTATLSYTVTNPPASCSITGTNGYSTSVSPTSGVQGSVTTTAITANTVFTLACGSTTLSATVGVTPEFEEQ